jgi:hypothetical protein
MSDDDVSSASDENILANILKKSLFLKMNRMMKARK